jgi:subtilase family serine protease
MLKGKRSRVAFGVGSLLAAGIAIAGTLLYTHSAHAATPSYHTHDVSINLPRVPAGTPTAAKFGCQMDHGPTAIRCNSPQMIYQSYGINDLLNHGITGKGHAIVIIDAFQNPLVTTDLQAFDTTFGLPAPVFNQIAPDGLTPFNPTDPAQVNFAGEITLDVQWAHAIAPAARIDLVLAKTDSDADILSATEFAINHNLGDVISQSFGENESCVDPALLKRGHADFVKATREHITLLASSGDEGAAFPTCGGLSWTQAVSTPASDPLVTAVGATELHNTPDVASPGIANPPAGTYENEIALNQTNIPINLRLPGNFSTGGGFSTLYHRPEYQEDVATQQGNHRGMPDIAFTGGINFGVLTACSICLPGQPTVPFVVFGGTSVGSPNWAGLIALANQLAGHRLGFINASLYRISENDRLARAAFHDITIGNNTVTEPDANGNPVNVQGFNALPGWDATTGLGTPKANALLPILVALNSFDDGDGAIAHDH